MGWVWLGAQGQRLGWSFASGVLPVALWWALRLMLAQWPAWVDITGKRLSTGLGVLTAAGAWSLAQAESTTTSLSGLMALTVVWAFWTSALDHQAASLRRCQRPWSGWQPMIAALAVWLTAGVPQATGTGVALALMGAACLAFTSPAHTTAPHLSHGTLANAAPQTAMGLMMGSLWLNSQWCANVGWSIHTVVGLHLALMAVLPGLIRLDLLPRQLPPMANQLLPLAMVMAGCGLLWSEQRLAHGLTGMVLLAVAWALPARPTNTRSPSAAQTAPASGQWWSSLMGPLLLLAIGAASPLWGPHALANAYAGLGLLAGFTLVRRILSHLPNARNRSVQQ